VVPSRLTDSQAKSLSTSKRFRLSCPADPRVFSACAKESLHEH
jgi:hypothetical protein